MLGIIFTFLFGPDTLVPQGYCLLWRPELVMLHSVAGVVYGVTCAIIAAGVWSYARRRADLEFARLYRLLACVVLLCGCTALVDVVMIWYPLYGAQGVLKAIAAAAGVICAYRLWQALPAALAVPTLRSLRETNRDLTRSIAEHETKLEACQSELTASHREMDAVAHAIAHDLRRPLTAIGASVALLAEGHAARLDAPGREALDQIRAASARTGSLIDDLLHMSRLTRVPLRITQVDLSELAAEIVKELRLAEPGRRVTVMLAKDAVIDCDRELMRIALGNLLKNAWKFTAKQENPKIEFGYQRRGAKTMFYVRDNGVGFNMEDAGKLFLPFQRLHEAAEFSGNGVGLAVVARIIHRHGGDIKAEASLGKGTSITFSI